MFTAPDSHAASRREEASGRIVGFRSREGTEGARGAAETFTMAILDRQPHVTRVGALLILQRDHRIDANRTTRRDVVRREPYTRPDPVLVSATAPPGSASCYGLRWPRWP